MPGLRKIKSTAMLAQPPSRYVDNEESNLISRSSPNKPEASPASAAHDLRFERGDGGVRVGRRTKFLRSAPLLSMSKRIPIQHHLVMATHRAVEPPDDLATCIDDQTRSRTASSQAAVAARAMEHERCYSSAALDACISATSSQPDDLDGLATWTARQPINTD